MTKLKAALIHLTLSIIAIGILLLIIMYIWYPKPFFDMSQVHEPLQLLLMIDVIVGPLLTFVVYKKNKKLLRLDLTIIAVMQLAALSYGVYTIYQGRPSLIVMADGEFHYLAEKFSHNNEIKDISIKPSLFSKPKYTYLLTQSKLDIYGHYADFNKIDDFKLSVLPHSFSLDDMKFRFKKKVEQLNKLNKKYQDDKIVFFLLDKNQAQHYVVFSTVKNVIIDQLKF